MRYHIVNRQIKKTAAQNERRSNAFDIVCNLVLEEYQQNSSSNAFMFNSRKLYRCCLWFEEGNPIFYYNIETVSGYEIWFTRK